jgi:glycosyltransferase involved in cell wall biosynthesis
MTVWAVGVVRDEADIIEATVTRMLRQVDHVLIADNGSVDGTDDILRSLDQVTVLLDPNPGFHADMQQARRTTALASLAGQRGADWVVPFDADEVWATSDGRRLGDVLDSLPENVFLARAKVLNHVITDRDPPGADAPARMVYRRAEIPLLPKAACRMAPGLYIIRGNHHATYRGVARPPCADGLVRVHHFPFRSPEQFARKISYKAEAPPDLSGRKRQEVGQGPSLPTAVEGLGRATWLRILREEGKDALMAMFEEEHRFADPDEAGLVFDPCP